MRRIGIDVGGTNTDAVLLEGAKVVRTLKTPTTSDVTLGIRVALAAVLDKVFDAADVSAETLGRVDVASGTPEERREHGIDAVMIGTTLSPTR